MCDLGLLLTYTSEEGLSLFKEEVAVYFPLSSFGVYRLQQREGFFASGYLVLKRFLGIYGLIKIKMALIASRLSARVILAMTV